MKKMVTAKVVSQTELAPGIYDMRLESELSAQARPGQFIGVYTKDASRLLPRPISICETDGEKVLRIVYRVNGGGTEEFSGYKEGTEVRILGVLGNGYDMEKLAGKKTALFGGGIGIPPMLELAKKLSASGSDVSIFLGYRDSNLFLKEDFDKYGKVYIATEDGSVGTKGNVLNALAESKETPDVLLACGPMPMLSAIKKEAEGRNIPAYISLEERMACGVGACLGCVCRTTHKDNHSKVNNARVCTEGPVFNAEDVEI